MPQFQAMVSRANTAFNRTAIAGVDETLFEPGKNLGDSLRKMGVAGTALEESFIDGLPKQVQEVIRATIYSCLMEAPRLELQVQWWQAGHVEVGVQSVRGTTVSQGAAQLVLKTPLP